MPDKTLAIKGDECKNGTSSKLRLSVLFGASITGEKLRPLVIGKYAKPRCFKNTNMANLAVTYTANKKAWMVRSLFTEWLSDLNEDLMNADRKILLFIDNCKPHENLPEFSHVRVEYLPPNITSRLQPLDMGTIRCFKALYRRLLVNYVINSMDQLEEHQSQKDLATKLASRVNVLDAVNWIDNAWADVKAETIQNCFRKAGFVTRIMEDVNNTEHIEEPEIIQFQDYDMDNFVSCDEAVATCEATDYEAVFDVVFTENRNSVEHVNQNQPNGEMLAQNANQLVIKQTTENEPVNEAESEEFINSMTVSSLEDARIVLTKVLDFSKAKCPEIVGHISHSIELIAAKINEIESD